MEKRLRISCLVLLCCFTIVSGLVCWECEEVRSQEECLRRGSAVRCKPNQDQCHLTLRHGGWGSNVLIEKACKTTKACAENYIQNIRSAWSIKGEQVQCNENYPSSVCRCCCGTDLCNQNRTSCLLSDVKRSCDALRVPRNGKMHCYNGFNLQSSCNFECKRGYHLIGQTLLTCSAYGNWNYAAPRCRGVICLPRLKTPQYGSMRCSGGIRLGARCRFACEEGYRLTTPPSVQCIDDENGDQRGVWSSPQPRCIPKQCEIQRPLRHGMITCSNENYVGSECSFVCDSSEGYFLVPSSTLDVTTLTCLRNESWDMPRPCCSLNCPQFATMDLVIVLDSSSSVGSENWKLMIDFINMFVRQFTVRDDATHFAAIRYNSKVDRRNQITFNDYPDSTEGVVNAINKIPYDGSGTETGEALDYVSDVLLPLGNRELATNVVLLLTDGRSQDDVAFPARRLRGNALVYVVPIQAEGGEVDLNQISSIAGPGNQDRILTDALDGGFEALDGTFVNKITERLCDTPCFNPLHDHPDDTRDP